MWVFSFYSMVDGFFVANFVSAEGLSAVNLSLPFINTMFSVGILFAVGTQTVIGVLKGGDEHEIANETFSFTFTTLLIFALAVTVLCGIFLDEIITFLGAEAEYHDLVKSYLGIILFFAPFFIISYDLEIIVKVDGFPKLATLGVLSSSIINIVLDWLFVAKWHWGLRGAAIATGLAQVASTILFLQHFIRGKSYLHFVPFDWNFKIYKKILPIGFGDFLSELSGAFVLLVFNLFLIDTLGYYSIAIFTVINYVSQIVLSTMVGITQGIQPLCSYYYGQKKPKNYRKIFYYALLTVTFFMILAVGIVQIFPEKIFGLFLDESNGALMAEASGAIRRFSLGYILSGYSLVIAGYHSSLGKAKASITINLFQGYIAIVAALVIMTTFFAPDMIWWSYLLAQSITFVVAILILFHTRRKTDEAYGLNDE